MRTFLIYFNEIWLQFRLTIECTQLQSSRDIQSTSKQASGPRGSLKMAYWTLRLKTLDISSKKAKHVVLCFWLSWKSRRIWGQYFFFSCKNTYIPGKLLFIATANQNRISVRSSINQTIPESMEVNICRWQCFCDRNTFLRYDTFRCSRHAHQESKLQLLTWASTTSCQVSRNSFPIWELRRGCSWDPSTF